VYPHGNDRISPPLQEALLEDDFPGMPFGGDMCWFPDVKKSLKSTNELPKQIDGHPKLSL